MTSEQRRELIESFIGEAVSLAGEVGIDGICECGRPRSKHVIIAMSQLEVVWEIGICATICAHINVDEVAVWVHDGSTVEDPCDTEFMEAISS